MRMKDIKVGEEYAIGAPNTSYDEWKRLRGRVTKVGVHGTTRSEGRGYSRYMSDRATYVEFEIVKDEKAAGSSYSYRHRIVEDPSSRYGERMPESYGREAKEIKEVLRCLGAHVLMPWSEFLPLLAEHEEREAKDQTMRDERRAKAADIRERFKKLGYEADGYKTWCFEFSTEDAEGILEVLEREETAENL